MSHNRPRPHNSAATPQTGLARALSKMGYCSRHQAWELIRAGRVRVNGVARRDGEWRVALGQDHLAVDGQPLHAEAKVYLMLNKPRGLVTTVADEQGRETVFKCLANQGLPWLAPVGRLDKASEGLLLFTNDTAWAARMTAPESGLDKTYHVQVDCLAARVSLAGLVAGVTSEGDFLSAKQARVLRQGTRHCWLELILDEGKNRHIRRLLAAWDIHVLRLVRVAIGPLPLGALGKGHWRYLTEQEIQAVSSDTISPSGRIFYS